MQFKKAFITIFLLFAYAAGFSHNLIPHSHHTDGFGVVSGNHQAHHQHHEANDNEDMDHQHIAHKGHFDEGLFDFIICHLVESEHPASAVDLCFYLPGQINETFSYELFKVKSQCLRVVAFYISDLEFSKTFNSKEVSKNSNPRFLNFPQRGPPFIS